MKKSARRTLSLALSLVLICALAATVFAASDGWGDHYQGIYIDMVGEVNRSDATGEVSVDYIRGASRLEIDMTYTYYPMPAGSPAATLVHSDYETSNNFSITGAMREFSTTVDLNGSCFSMIAVTYHFNAEFPYVSGRFESAPYSIEY